jgi:hypothetical protein
MEDFISKKNMQDELLNRINQHLVKINHDMNDKLYQEYLNEQKNNNNNTNNM